jgi:hypothetical protein
LKSKFKESSPGQGRNQGKSNSLASHLNICLVKQTTLPDQAPIQFLIANTPGAALGDSKKLVDRFMADKPKIAPQEPICKNSPGVDRGQETGADFLISSLYSIVKSEIDVDLPLLQLLAQDMALLS